MITKLKAKVRSSAVVAISVTLWACSGSSDGSETLEGFGTNDTPGSGGGSATQPASGMGTPAGGPVAGGTSGGGTGGASSLPSMTAKGGGAGSATPPPVDASCGLPNAAFCDAFTQKSPGGRAGDLDDAKWSFSRLGFGCTNGFAFPATKLNVCGVWQAVNPGGPDSEFCTNENNDPRWVEGFNDNTSFNYIAARVRQPFDFKDRTGTLQWEADARTSGGHGWWLETWITDDPVPGPNQHDMAQLVTSKNAIGMMFDVNCGVPPELNATSGSGLVGVSNILVVNNYQLSNHYDPFSAANHNSRCVKTAQGSMNIFQLKISKSRVEVWASDAGSKDLIRIAEADVAVPFERGYLNLSHVHYNAHKAEVTMFQAYQWARVAFDGPRLSTPRAYEIADPLTPVTGTCGTADAFRIAYAVTDGLAYNLDKGRSAPYALKFTGVDPTGATAARLNFNTTFVVAGNTLRYRLNGRQWHDYLVPDLKDTWERQGFSVPVPATDLVAGDNTIEFATNTVPAGMPANSMQVSNIDLEIEVP
jgi:hypothetical protein